MRTLSAASLFLFIGATAHASLIQQFEASGTSFLGIVWSAAGELEFDATSGDIHNLIRADLEWASGSTIYAFDRSDIDDSSASSMSFAYTITDWDLSIDSAGITWEKFFNRPIIPFTLTFRLEENPSGNWECDACDIHARDYDFFDVTYTPVHSGTAPAPPVLALVVPCLFWLARRRRNIPSCDDK